MYLAAANEWEFLMDHLLIVPLKQNLAENLLTSLRQAGWRITVTVDIVCAKQLLQQGGMY